jgi:hypothetical protein
MSVDLDELSERWHTTAFAMASSDQSSSSDIFLATVRAVLDAPRVWWCEVVRDVELDPSECDNCDPALRCGWVVLVPVGGEG